MITRLFAVLAASLALGACLVAASSAAQQEIRAFGGDDSYEAVIIPPDSPVHLERNDEQSNTFRFRGDFVFSGTYWYGYDEVDGEENELSLFINTDPDSVKSLPYWKRWGRPTTIYIRNSADFVKAALPPEVVGKLARKQLRSVHGHIAIVAKNYVVTGECDHPVFLADFVSVYRPKTMILSKAYSASSC
jgi:hypothetical protein